MQPKRAQGLVVATLLWLWGVVMVSGGASTAPPAPEAATTAPGQATASVPCLLRQGALAERLSQSIEQACILRPNVTNPATYDALTQEMAQLLSVCTSSDVTPLRAVKLLVALETAPLYQAIKPTLEVVSGFKIEPTYVPYSAMVKEIMVSLDNRLNLTDAWAYDAYNVVDMAESRGGFGFVDLQPYINEDESMLQWADVHPFFRQVSSIYQGQVVGIPILAFQVYQFYRKDAFRKLNLTVPVTWDEFIDVVVGVNGTDTDGDGQPDFSLCLTVEMHMVLSVLATFVQTSGPSQGVLWDPVTMKALVNNPAMAETLRIFQLLKPYSRLNDIGTSPDFNKCLLTLGAADVFKASHNQENLKGKIGTAMFPGATQVLDRTTMQLVPCEPGLCSDTAVDKSGKSKSINRAPTAAPSSISIGINPHVTLSSRAAAWRAMTALASPAIHSETLIFNPYTQFGPMRLSQMDTSPEGLAKWTRKGYNIEDTREFLTVTRAILSHPNHAPDLSIKNMDSYKAILDEEFRKALMAGQDITVTMDNLDTKFKAIMLQSGDPARVAASYRAQLQFQFPSPPPNPPMMFQAPPAATSSKVNTDVLIPAVVVPVLCCVMLAVVFSGLMQLAKRAQKRHRSLLGGAVTPPKINAQTTLLVTDVEGSTKLFETIPEAMDAAMAIHNTLLSRIIDKHSGYASASEGDGWVVAFHTPADALLAAAELQEALMAADWPAKLLEQPNCQPTWVTASSNGPIGRNTWTALRTRLNALDMRSTGVHHLLAISGVKHGTTGAGVPINQGDQAFDGVAQEAFPDAYGFGWQNPSSTMLGPWDTTHDTFFPVQPMLHSLRASDERLGQPSGEEDPTVATAAHSSAYLAQGPFLGCSLQQLWATAFTLNPPPPNQAGDKLAMSTGSYMPPQTKLVSKVAPGAQPASLLDRPEKGIGVGRHDNQTSSNHSIPHSAHSGHSWHQPPTNSRISHQFDETPEQFRRKPFRSENGGFSVVVNPLALENTGGPGGGGFRFDPLAFASPSHNSFSINPLALQDPYSRGPGPVMESQGNNVGSSFALGGQEQDSDVHGRRPRSDTQNNWSVGRMVKGWFRTNTVVKSSHTETFVLEVGGDAMEGMLAYRGLRVRMGLHSGLVNAEDVVVNKSTGRHQYGGGFLEAAKTVMDAGPGGMVLASQELFQSTNWPSLAPHMVVLAAGEYRLRVSAGLPPMARALYEVVPHGVALRVVCANPLRILSCKQLGYQVAPCGTVAIAYFQAVGVPALASWDAQVTHQSLQLLTSVATSLLSPFGGYLLDSSEALGILAAFSSSADAIKWALVTQQALLQSDWPAELLDHPLGEELGIAAHPAHARGSITSKSGPFPASKQAASVQEMHRTSASRLGPGGRQVTFAVDGGDMGSGLMTQKLPYSMLDNERTSFSLGASPLDPGPKVGGGAGKTLLLRGLRTKCGIDVGSVRSTINEISGRITYVGKVMNRAARVTAATKSGQVWCSSGAWDTTSVNAVDRSMFPDSFSTVATGRQDSMADVAGPRRVHLPASRSQPRLPRHPRSRSMPGNAPIGMDNPDLSTGFSQPDMGLHSRHGMLTLAPVAEGGDGRSSRFSAQRPSNSQQQQAAAADPKQAGFGTLANDLPVRASRQRLSGSDNSNRSSYAVPVDDMSGPNSDSIARALDMAAELAYMPVSAVSLGPHKLKSIQEPVVLIRVELDATTLGNDLDL